MSSEVFPIFGVSFLCHFNILPLHGELRNPTRARIKRVIYTTIGLTFCLYFTVALFGYVNLLPWLLLK